MQEHGIFHTKGIPSKGQVLYLNCPTQLTDTSFSGVVPQSGETRSCHYTLVFPNVVSTVHTFAY